MELDTLNYLFSSDGEKLLTTAGCIEGSLIQKLTALRKHYPATLASSAIDMIDLRKRASAKFSRANEMFFTREALEQASGEIISSYRSERYEKDCRVLDLACGIGGDTISLARRCHVTAVDSDPVRIAMARRNLEVYGLSDRVDFVCADATNIPLNADAAFLDPSRRSNGRRVVRLHELSPSLEFMHRLSAQIPACGIKLSPASDDRDLNTLGGETEFISVSGECREATAWFGPMKTTNVRATVLPATVSLERSETPEIPLRTPGRYLYEPDPSIIRAHLIEQVADMIGAGRIDAMIAYITSDTLVDTPFARAYAILEGMPYNLKAVRSRFRGMDAGKVIVKKRGVPFDPLEVEHDLRVSGSHTYVLVITRIGTKPWAFLCVPAESEGEFRANAEI